VNCTKIPAEFKFGGHSPWVRLQNCGVGLYDVGKISAGCLVFSNSIPTYLSMFFLRFSPLQTGTVAGRLGFVDDETKGVFFRFTV